MAMTQHLESERAPASSETAKAYLFLALAMLSWSGNIVVARALAGIVPPLGLSLMRWSIAFIVVLPFAAAELVAKRAIVRRNWFILLVLGLLGLTICNSLSYVGVQWTTAINGALVNSAGPMLTLAASFAFYRERVTRRQIAGILVSLLGVVVIVIRGDATALFDLSINIGDLVILVSVGTWSIYTVMLPRRPSQLSP